MAGGGERRSTLQVGGFQPGGVIIGGGSSESGVHVDELVALTLSSVWRAVTVLSTAIGAMPWTLYRQLPGASRGLDPEHPVSRLITQRANPNFTSQRFREKMMRAALLGRGGYAEIQRNRLGQAVALWPIETHRVQPELVPGGSGVYRYRVSPPAVPAGAASGRGGRTTRGGVVLGERDVLRVHMPGFDDHAGLLAWTSPVALAREAIGQGIAAGQFTSRVFANDARPGVVLSVQKRLSPEAQARLRESVEARYGGRNRGSAMVLEEGTTIDTLDQNLEHAGQLETRREVTLDVARFFGVPPHVLGELGRATWQNVASLGEEFVRFTIQPWVQQWYGEARKLLPEAEVDLYETEMDVQAFRMPTEAERADVDQKRIMSGVSSIDEVRIANGMNPIGGAIGNLHAIISGAQSLQTLVANGAGVDGGNGAAVGDGDGAGANGGGAGVPGDSGAGSDSGAVDQQ